MASFKIIVGKILLLQLMIALLCVILYAVIVSNQVLPLVTIATGSLIAIVATIVQAGIIISAGSINTPIVFFKRQRLALLIKFLCNAALFMIVFSCYKQLNTLLILLSYMINSSAFWFSLFAFKNKI